MKNNRQSLFTILILFVVIASLVASPRSAHAACAPDHIIYVSPAGSNAGGCTWATAFTTLQSALAIASGTDPDQIWVRSGTYYPDEGTGQVNNDRASTYQLIDGVSVYGGFAGTETLLTQRNPTLNVTILSGDIDQVAGNANNAYTVVTITGALTDTFVLDGFTITAGNSSLTGIGGGIYIEDTSPTLANLIITANNAGSRGGGVYVISVSQTLEANYSSPTFADVTFSSNTANIGGGLYIQNGSPALTRIVFTGNTASTGAGGGMNSQTFGGIGVDEPNLPTLTDVTFSSNTAVGGGGLYNNNSTTALNNVTFSGNTANRRGGGILNEQANPTLTNVTFSGNTSNESTGAAPWGGGGIMNLGSDPVLNNVTFNGNNSVNGSGTAGGDAMKNMTDLGNTSAPVINNSIFWGNGGISDEILNVGASTATIQDSVIQGGCPALATCTNVITTDPLLSALASNGGFTQTMAIGATSSALDTGGVNFACAATDQRGTVRPQGAACDIGAYERGDLTPPILNSFTRFNPLTTPTNADTLVFRATFNEGVLNVSTGDFVVTVGTTATVTGVSVVSTSVYEITVSGGDLAGFNGVVGLDLAGGQNITDLSSNALPAGEPATDETYLVDNTAPTLNSFTRFNPLTTPTNADTLVFRATFSETVVNVSAGDFAVNGTTTATVTLVTPISGTVYEVTVSGGDLAGFNGVVGLNLAGGQDITDSAGNALPAGEPATDETYLVDNTGPTLASFTRQNPATTPTNADTLVFRATFSETVVNVSVGDFVVNGTTTATVTLVTPVSGTVYDITVSGGDLAGFNGIVGIDLAGAQNITDTAGNALPAGEPATDETYLLDNTAPALNSFTRFNPLTTPTNVDTLVFRATFNENVVNVSVGDFVVNGTTTATITLVTPISGTVYEVTVSGGDLAGFNGVVGIDLSGAQNITDSAGNALPAGEPATDETYLLDNTAPALNSFTRFNPLTTPTNADTLVFRATFSETVVNVSVGDFVVNGTTTATVTLVTPISGTIYEITVSGGDLAGFNGVVGIDLSGAQNITDSAGNALPAGEPATDETYTIENTAPTLNSFTRFNPLITPTNADSLVFRATFSETVVNVSAGDFAVNGTTTATVTLVTPISGTVYEITVSGGDLAGFNGVVGIDLTGGQDITDAAGNALPAGEPATDETYTVDNTGPTLTSFTRQTPATTPTNADTLVFRATFSETVLNVSVGDFGVNGTTTATVTLVTPVSGTVYDVTVSGGDLAGFNGVVGIDLSGAQNITDTAGNALPAGEPATDETYLVDNTAPSLLSFTRFNPLTSPTNADTLVFRAAFSETVVNVSVGDFAVNGTTTAIVTLVTPVSGTIYEITVSGGDLAGFNGVVGLNLAGGQDITDSAGNALPAGEPATDETYLLDNTAPALNSFTRFNPLTTPTNADTLVFRATFSETVVNVSTGDFAVNGTTTATVTLVTPISGTVYEITVFGGDLAGFNGVVGIDLTGGQDITDSAGNALPAGEPATDETYTVENTAPTLNSFTRFNPLITPTNADSLVFRATFSETVVNVSAGDFAVNGTTTATVTLVTPISGTVYEVTVSGGDLAGFNGAVGLNLAGGQDITDSAGNALPAGEPATDETYTVDNTAPTLNSFTRFNPLTTPTNADVLVFRATFSETVVNVSVGDFAVNGTTTATVTLVTPISGTVYEVTVSGGDLAGFNGTVGLNLSGAQNITDSAGNALPAGEPATDETYLVDNNVPTLNSFTRFNPLTTPTNADTLVFRATFSETVVNVSVGDFLVNGTTTATVTLVTPISGTIYEITVSGGDLAGFNGVVGIDLSGAQDITNVLGNALPAGEPVTDETYLVDNNVPTLTSFTRQTPATTPTNADTLVFRATFSETVVNVSVGDFVVNGTTTATVTLVTVVSGTVYDITVSGGDLAGFNGVVGLNLGGAQDITDALGNALPAGEPATDETYLVDNTAPSLLSFTRFNPLTTPTNADVLIFRATFSETVVNVSVGDFVVNGTTTATVTLVTPISGTVYEVTVSGGDLAGFNGVVGLNLAGAQNITDSAGNTLPAGEPATDETYTVENTAPVLQSFTRFNPLTTPTNADTLVFRATFSEAVVNVSVGDFAVNGTTTATVTLVTPISGTVYEITVSGGDLAGFNGVVGLNLGGAQDITDALGNALPAGEPATDETYTLDNSGPTLTSFTRQTPATTPTNADTLVFRATFGETVVNVSAGDFAVNGATTAIVTLVTPISGSVYDVTVSGGDLAGFNGVVGIDLSGAQNITDTLGNALPAGEPATDETYVVDNAGPTVTVEQAGADPTGTSPIPFTITFSEAVSGFTFTDVSLAGTAGATGVAIVGGPTVYTANISGMTGDGTVIASLLAGVAIDAAGNGNAASTSIDNTVTYDTTGPVVTIGAPSVAITTAGPVDFAITITGGTTFNLTLADITLNTTGTATGTVSVAGGNTANPIVTISATTGSGTIGISIAAGIASDALGNTSPAAGPSATFIVDNGGPVVTASVPANTASVTGPTQLTVTFNEDVSAATGNNIANYLLLNDSGDGFDDAPTLTTCLTGLNPNGGNDLNIAINSAVYTNGGGIGPFVSTLGINGGVPLPVGVYRLYVCGTTSIEDLVGNELNNGLNDTIIQFTVIVGTTGTGARALIPATGFPQGVVTTLPIQPADKAYAATDMWIEIPKLNVKMSIVGVPQTKDGWDVKWLGRDAGWLNGSAFPTWSGNSVLTSHVWDALGKPGPFALLKDLKYGDLVKIHAFGQVFTYEIRESSLISPKSISTMLQHEEKSWLTLITCELFNEKSETYTYRRMVRAVLISVAPEK